MLSRIEYAAYLQYSPRGTSEISIRSRQGRDVIKAGRKDMIADVAKRIGDDVKGGLFNDWFDGEVTLVPVPGSAPLKDKDALWVPKLICEALLAEGVGNEISTCLARISAVKKSAYSAPGARPSVQEHYDSFEVTMTLIPPKPRIVLVDDFVTKGRTLTAACSRVSEAYEHCEVRAFTVFRTRGFDEVDPIIFPFEGHIAFNGYDANRGD